MTRETWNSLRYPISLHQLSEEEGGGWMASIPMLGKAAFIADGETVLEAMDELEARRRRFYEMVIQSGKPIPIPADITDEANLPSGKWLMRTSPQFHAELQQTAERRCMSLNAYCNHCLERGHSVTSMEAAAREVLTQVFTGANQRVELTERE